METTKKYDVEITLSKETNSGKRVTNAIDHTTKYNGYTLEQAESCLKHIDEWIKETEGVYTMNYDTFRKAKQFFLEYEDELNYITIKIMDCAIQKPYKCVVYKLTDNKWHKVEEK